MTAEWRVVLAGLRPGDRPGSEHRSRVGEGAAARSPACPATAVAAGGAAGARRAARGGGRGGHRRRGIRRARDEAQRKTADAALDRLASAVARDMLRPGPEWSRCNLEDVRSAIIDNLHSNPVYAEDGVPCVRSPDVGWGTLDLTTARRTTEEEVYERRTSARGAPRRATSSSYARAAERGRPRSSVIRNASVWGSA